VSALNLFGGLVCLALASLCLWCLRIGLVNREFSLRARGGGTFWLRHHEHPFGSWFVAGTFAVCVLIFIWLAIIFPAGCGHSIFQDSCLLRDVL